MKVLDPLDPEVWEHVRSTVRRARSSSMHCSIASTNPDGSPHVSPIGSVMLGDPGRGAYLDVFNVQLGRNLDRDPRCTILAVDSSRVAWGRALLRGRFDRPPGARLIATVGSPRPATAAEVERFRSWFGLALRTPGGRSLLGRRGELRARDLTITGVVPVRVAAMTQHLWPESTGTGTAAEPAERGAARTDAAPPPVVPLA